MKNAKLNVIRDYDTLNDELKEQVKLVYPSGFYNSIIEFINKNRKKVHAIRFETEEKIYLLRLSKKMVNRLMEVDEEFDDVAMQDSNP
jgi:hypothetical protein